MSGKTAKREGILIVYTGNGQGKTTAALGLALRACGHGMRVSVLQFIKGTMFTGELSSHKHVPGMEIVQLGRGFIETGPDGKPTREHVEAARDGLKAAEEKMRAGDCDMVVLDEIITAMGRELLEGEEVKRLLRERPAEMTLVMTGRGAPEWLIDEADLVTEMREIKHPYARGMKAKPGVEY